MNRISPLTYLIGGMAAVGLANIPVDCAPIELLNINSPTNQTCGDYLAPYLLVAGGRILNPETMGQCNYCPVAETNDLLATLEIFYWQRWRDFGFLLVFVIFNVGGAFLFYWVARARKG